MTKMLVMNIKDEFKMVGKDKENERQESGVGEEVKMGKVSLL